MGDLRLMVPHRHAHDIDDFVTHMHTSNTDMSTVQMTVGEPEPQSQSRRIQAVHKLWENLTRYQEHACGMQVCMHPSSHVHAATI